MRAGEKRGMCYKGFTTCSYPRRALSDNSITAQRACIRQSQGAPRPDCERANHELVSSRCRLSLTRRLLQVGRACCLAPSRSAPSTMLLVNSFESTSVEAMKNANRGHCLSSKNWSLWNTAHSRNKAANTGRWPGPRANARTLWRININCRFLLQQSIALE